MKKIFLKLKKIFTNEYFLLFLCIIIAIITFCIGNWCFSLTNSCSNTYTSLSSLDTIEDLQQIDDFYPQFLSSPYIISYNSSTNGAMWTYSNTMASNYYYLVYFTDIDIPDNQEISIGVYSFLGSSYGNITIDNTYDTSRFLLVSTPNSFTNDTSIFLEFYYPYSSDSVCSFNIQIYQLTSTLKDLYQEAYTNGYDSGFYLGDSIGYERGYNQGLLDNENYTFLNLIGAVIDAPITAFKGLFNFDFLGFNMLSFVEAILSIMFIVFIINIIRGN